VNRCAALNGVFSIDIIKNSEVIVMDFGFSEEQLAIKKEVIAFARQELNRDMVAHDKQGSFFREGWKKCADFGILGLPFPTQYGGSEADIITTTLAMEGLGYACKDAGLIFGMNAQMWSIQMPIWEFGTEEQKQKYLPVLCKGEIIGGHGMSEPDSGSDAFSLKTTAVKKGDHYVLNGSKTFVTNAPESDLFVVFASTDKVSSFLSISGFLIERDTPGFKVGKEISKMGLKTSPMAEIVMEDCLIPKGNLLGQERQGAKIFNSSMAWERSCILAGNLGAMERQLEACIKYANERRQFKKPIGKFQSVANKIVDMKLRLETARLLLYKVAWTKQRNTDATLDAALAKLYVSEAWVQSSLDAIQIHGGYGFTAEYEVERDLRDAIGGRLYSGTNEIQRNIIARMLKL
jgi:alkylation response protein AidB-like acyl-CoA dehydrogenase